MTSESGTQHDFYRLSGTEKRYKEEGRYIMNRISRLLLLSVVALSLSLAFAHNYGTTQKQASQVTVQSADHAAAMHVQPLAAQPAQPKGAKELLAQSVPPPVPPPAPTPIIVTGPPDPKGPRAPIPPAWQPPTME